MPVSSEDALQQGLLNSGEITLKAFLSIGIILSEPLHRDNLFSEIKWDQPFIGYD